MLIQLKMYGACKIKGPFSIIVESLKLEFPPVLEAIVVLFDNLRLNFITILTDTRTVETITTIILLDFIQLHV